MGWRGRWTRVRCKHVLGLCPLSSVSPRYVRMSLPFVHSPFLSPLFILVPPINCPSLDPAVHPMPISLHTLLSILLTCPPAPLLFPYQPTPQDPDELEGPSTTTATPTRPTTHRPTTGRCMGTPPPRATRWPLLPQETMSPGHSSPTTSTRKCH